MKNGDISADVPPRIIVLIDLVVESAVVEERTLFSKKQSQKITRLKNPELTHLWNLGFKYGLAMELAAFESDGWTTEAVASFMDRLDNRGGNPFNYFEVYATIQDLIDELPYRSNLKGVVTNGQAARFGSWGLDLEFI